MFNCIFKAVQPYAPTVLRIGLGISFAYHGAQKVFGVFGGHGMEGFTGFVGSLGLPFPELFAWAAALSEFVGGILLILGFLTNYAAIFLAITMAVAFFGAHKGSFADGGDTSFVFGIASLSLMFSGAGKFGLDSLIASKRTSSCACGCKHNATQEAAETSLAPNNAAI